ncbi:DUF1697 domain-containing protein [Bradyrhizobium sp. Ce-3]|uniref:DUF1697 domain-containing protein n=1 Tax=Bradyrhizobium sp. Ce-3 TaxID=2913970 RepID=UPI001FC7E39A|nr:DUF1697 domain-containing protein [Bradyrhizobium sp. Ce-3]GKQ55437.1 hypothetical protein BRSPCE3_62920 [Bradyrhizobium sp. Ce-3]
MPRYVALLRAVNVGGTGKLPMTELKAMCLDAGFADVQTYIASGNVVFSSRLGAAKVKAALEQRLQAYAGKPVGVAVRSAEEIAAVVKANPFPKAPPNFTVAIFLDEPPPKDALKHVKGQQDEQLKLGKREIYVAYGSGMGRSKLKIPAAAKGTARNLNTIAKLAELAAGDE